MEYQVSIPVAQFNSLIAEIQQLRDAVKPKQQEQPLSTKEAARFLKIHVNTLYIKMKKGLPFHERDGMYYFYESELNTWIKSKSK
jgi:predicted DNA-binding transcriptional regulator AlpA